MHVIERFNAIGKLNGSIVMLKINVPKREINPVVFEDRRRRRLLWI